MLSLNQTFRVQTPNQRTPNTFTRVPLLCWFMAWMLSIPSSLENVLFWILERQFFCNCICYLVQLLLMLSMCVCLCLYLAKTTCLPSLLRINSIFSKSLIYNQAKKSENQEKIIIEVICRTKWYRSGIKLHFQFQINQWAIKYELINELKSL